MTDEITQNDCQGEACSLCGGKGFRREDEGNNFQICECAEIWPNETEAHANGFEMGYRAHTEVAAAEIASLREQLTEAREIIGGLDELLTVICAAMKDFAETQGVDASLIEPFARAPAEGSLFHRARAFLTKGETDDA